MTHRIHELLQQTGSLSLLYIEDNTAVRESTFDLLKIFFDDVDTAENGLEGFDKYRQYHQAHQKFYDIVLTDIRMPEMDGIELIRKIKEINDRQDIIVVSAHNEIGYLTELIDLEVTNFILKPFRSERFEKVFERVINIILQKRQFKHLHEELESARKKAEESNKQKSRFLANMSHEIRTPLNAIIGFISLLEEKEDDEEKLKYMHIIKNSSDTLLQIINDILDISKIESGKLKIEPYSFNPYKELITIAELFQAKATEKNIDFRIKYNSNFPKILYGDALRIKQIFTNLLSNAIKFTPEGGKVKSIIWYKNGHLNIVVKDYGIGISKEKQKSIFEPFTQADCSTERIYGGTGLGLTISLELSRLLNGDLSLKSEENKGSVFKLAVPLPLGKEEQSEEEEIVNLSGHILIVEDYEANRMFLGIILANAGLSYDMAHDGREAVEMFQTNKYDLILMDENMPNMDGIEALKHILSIEKKEKRPHTPIISLTANALQGDQERHLKAGFDAFLNKPVNPQLLLHTIKRHIHNP